MFVLFLALFYGTLALLAFYNFYYKRRGLPPGPAPLPFIGNLWTLRKYPPGEDVFLKWRNEYGPVYTYWIGEHPIVCVADYATIVETFQKDGDAYAGRKFSPEFERLFKGGILGVITTEGAQWREHRRFTLHAFRDFGVGKNLMQERILTEVSTLLERIDLAQYMYGAIDIAEHIDIAVGSIINVIMFGERFDGPRQKQFYHLKVIVHKVLESLGTSAMQLINAYPNLLIRLPYFRSFWRSFKAANNVVDAFLEEQIAGHMRELEESGGMDEVPTDYVHAFLQEKSKRDAIGEPHSYTLEQLKAMCFDLWVAGQETSSTTLAWGVAYLIKNPQCQAKLHEELDRVIGSERLITMTDRPHLPYTCAVVNETQRMSNLLAQNVLHRTTRDVKINGFPIKADTAIVPQISVVLSDPDIYNDSKRYDPSRHLDPSTGQLKKCEELIPFSVGKRQCLGEPLARMELFLFLANLFNQYELSPGGDFSELTRTHGSISSPVQCPHFTCLVTKSRYK